MEKLLIILSGAICTLITILLTNFFNKKKTAAEVRKMEAEIEKTKTETAKLSNDAIDSAFKMWQGLVEGLTTEVKELRNEISVLRKENNSLKAEMKKLEKLLNEQK